MEKVFNGYTFSWANINVEVANVCAAVDTLIDQDGVKLALHHQGPTFINAYYQTTTYL